MYEFSRTAEPQPSDEAVGEWSPEQFERMNALFVACLERAIATGSESASAAQANAARFGYASGGLGTEAVRLPAQRAHAFHLNFYVAPRR